MSRRHENLRFVLRIVTLGWAAISLIHFTIWALVCVIGGDLDSPWFLWFSVPSGVVIGALWWLLDSSEA